MSGKTKLILLVSIAALICSPTKAQIYYTMGDYRNVVTVSSGINSTFANATVGYARREYIKRFKTEIIGLLDVALPVTQGFFTRHIIRKGFQMNVYRRGDFKVPFTFASSSIIRHNDLVKYHDVTAEFAFNPGIYRAKYTLALDLRYEIIVFRHFKYSPKYIHDVDSKAKSHWNEPLTNVFKTGVVAAYNYKAVVLFVKAGYEDNPFIRQYPFINHNRVRWYGIMGFGYKFGKKPQLTASGK